MNSEEKFKHILNSKLEASEFSFDEANWDKAQVLLNAQEKKKRRLFWFFLSSCTALLIGGAYLLLFNNIAPATLISDATVNTSTTPPLTNATNTVQKATAIAQQNKQEIAPILKNKTTKTIINKATQLVEVANNKSVTVDYNTTKTIQQSETTAYVNTQATVTIKQQKLITKLSKQLAQQQKKNSSNAKNNTSENLVNTIKNERFTSVENANDSKNNTTKETLHNANIINDVTANTTVVSTNATTNTSKLIPNTIVITDSAILNNTPNEVATTSVNTNVQPIADTTKKKLEEPAKQIKYNYISLEAGANYALGWKTNQIKEGYGINPIVGINYIYTITKNIVLTIGAQYNALTHFKASADTITTTNYSFGVQKNETVTTPTKLNYIVAPIKIHYALNPNNSIGAGFNIAYLLRSKGTQATYTNTNGALSQSAPTKANNYPNGFNTYDVQLALCYKRKLINKLLLNAEFYCGLLGVKNNTFYNSTTTQRNTGIKLTLNYNLIQL